MISRILPWIAALGVSVIALGDQGVTRAESTSKLASASIPLIATPNTVRSRSAYGKLERFTDAANREFVMHYDSDGRITSVGAVRKRHVSDVHRIIYSENGHMLEVLLGSGYTLSFAYSDDGTQIVRDRFGGVLTRKAEHGRFAGGKLHSDPSGKLQAAVSGLDALIAASE